MPAATEAAIRLENAVDQADQTGKPLHLGGSLGTAAVSKAVMTALG